MGCTWATGNVRFEQAREYSEDVVMIRPTLGHSNRKAQLLRTMLIVSSCHNQPPDTEGIAAEPR
jgi:hypothetical protein